MVLAGTIISGPSIGSVVGIPSTGGSVLGTSVFRFTFALRMGMSGPEVLELQSRLSETGYFRGPMTGYFGPLTRDALMRLQRANGLAATGELDAQTIFLLNS
jgi:peptidoglycan hydrolase-like protein with peptidoglycan-binding domain